MPQTSKKELVAALSKATEFKIQRSTLKIWRNALCHAQKKVSNCNSTKISGKRKTSAAVYWHLMLATNRVTKETRVVDSFHVGWLLLKGWPEVTSKEEAKMNLQEQHVVHLKQMEHTSSRLYL